MLYKIINKLKMIINKNYFILLCLIITINSAKLKEGDELILIHVEYQYNITRFNLTVLNRDSATINDYLSSRIAFMDGSSSDDEIFGKFSTYINQYWMFLVNSTQVADKLLLRDDYDNNKLYINGIIVPKSLNYKMPDENNNEKIPIFTLEDNITQILKKYDIRKLEKNVYFIFEIIRAIANYPETYLLAISIVYLIISLALFAWFKILMKSTMEVNILPSHKMIQFIPLFLFITTISLIIKSIDIQGQDPNEESEGSIYIDTALITMGAIFKTLLWLNVLLYCSGWKISMPQLSRENLKFLIKMFVIIYVLLCLDQIVDYITDSVWVFHLSEIKNILFYAFMVYICITKINQNITFLNTRLYYARALSLEYEAALVYKIDLIKKFKIMLISYYCLFIILVFIHKVIIYQYDTTILEVYNYLLVDVYMTIFLCILMRPKTLPPGYIIDLGTDINNDLGIIYKAFLPKYKEINKKLENNKKDILACKGKKIPILVLGPCINNTENNSDKEYSINKYINNCAVGYSL